MFLFLYSLSAVSYIMKRKIMNVVLSKYLLFILSLPTPYFGPENT